MAQPTDSFLEGIAAQSSCGESKTPSFSILGRGRNNQRPMAKMHPKGYPKGVTSGVTWQFPRFVPPRMGYSMVRCAPCPATNFASAGLSEIQKSRVEMHSL